MGLTKIFCYIFLANKDWSCWWDWKLITSCVYPHSRNHLVIRPGNDSHSFPSSKFLPLGHCCDGKHSCVLLRLFFSALQLNSLSQSCTFFLSIKLQSNPLGLRIFLSLGEFSYLLWSRDTWLSLGFQCHVGSLFQRFPTSWTYSRPQVLTTTSTDHQNGGINPFRNWWAWEVTYELILKGWMRFSRQGNRQLQRQRDLQKACYALGALRHLVRFW